DVGPQLREQHVHEVAGAGGAVHVAVPDDAVEGDDRALGPVRARVGADGLPELPLRGRAVVRELPREEADERGVRRAGHAGAREVADERDAGRSRVEATGVSADHGPPDAATAALEDLAVAIDEEV